MSKNVGTFRVYYLDEEGNGFDEYIQALNAQDAADYVREYDGATEVVDVAKVMKNWK